MHHHRLRRGALALLAVCALAGASCSRSDDETESGSATTAAPGSGEGTDTTAAGGGDAPESRLDAGGFGDLENVCQDGTPADPGAGEPGITADSIQLGLVTDKGFSFRPGLNQEMYDAAVAFANWCNEHGGINGRDVVIADRDAAFSEYNTQVTAACSEDFALVGGGAVQDETDNGARVACGLPNFPGYVVSQAARTADLQVQALPFPLSPVMAGQYARIAESHPDLIDRYGLLLASGIQSIQDLGDVARTAVGEAGYSIVLDREYNPAGIDPTSARALVDELQANDVQVLEFIGEPVNLGAVQQAMDLVGYHPAITIQTPNFYDNTYLETYGSSATGMLVRTQYTPMEDADTNEATADYLELMERYNPSGKVAQLGQQALSALLLFAQSATACGDELTRACVVEQGSTVTAWTGGGMHATQNPAENTPSDCFALLSVSADGYAIDEEETAANSGIFNCDPANLVEVDAG